MTRVLLALAVFLSLAAQETKYPKDHFCMAGPPDKKTQAKGHECKCALVCTVDSDGNPMRMEDLTCAMYCRHDKCLCHEDQACEPKGI